MLKNHWIKASLIAVIVAVLVIVPLTVAFAGQPNQSCQAEPSTPGGSASAPGSAFNPNGTAGAVYAGNGTNNAVNSHTVAQYDVACFEVSTH